MSIYDLTCIKNDVCDKAVCDYKECKNRADTIEVMKHSVQQLKPKMPSFKECAIAIKLPSCQGDLFIWQRKGAMEMYEYIAHHFWH
jgi:hypothetical protein